MPKQLEEKLKKEAHKKGLKGDKFNAYIYGSLACVKDWNKRKINN